jgi:hypothetical protein
VLEDSRLINIRLSLDANEIEGGSDDNCIRFFRLKTTQLLGFAARCKLASPTTITIILGTPFSANMFQHDLYLRQGVLRLALSNNLNSNPELNLILPYSPRVPTPIAILRAPLMHTSGLPLVLDASASMDSQGQLSVAWSCDNGGSSVVQSMLESASDLVISLPPIFLNENSIMFLRIDVMNACGVSSNATAKVEIVNGGSILVSISKKGRAYLCHLKQCQS